MKYNYEDVCNLLDNFSDMLFESRVNWSIHVYPIYRKIEVRKHVFWDNDETTLGTFDDWHEAYLFLRGFVTGWCVSNNIH